MDDRTWTLMAERMLAPTMRGHNIVILAWTKTPPDPAAAMQLGMTLMTGQPLILMVGHSVVMPERLAHIVDGIVHVEDDYSDVGSPRVNSELDAIRRKIRKERR